jgi:hypothetical protein
MARKIASQEVTDEVFKYLKDFGPEGGTWWDIFDKSGTLGKSEIKDGLFTLEQQGQAIRERRFKGPGRGAKPEIWRLKEAET